MAPRVRPISEFVYEMGRPVVAGVIRDLGGQVFNVKAYGAVGDAVANDAAAIDAAVTAAQVNGGVVYFPTGRYVYSGTGIVNDPAAGQVKPLLLLGDGTRQSEINVTSLTNAQFVKLDHQDIIGNEVSRGSGVVGLYILLPAAKDGIWIKDQEDFRVCDVVTRNGRNALHVDESRFGLTFNCGFFNWTGIGMKITGENFAQNAFDNVTSTGTGSSTGYGFEYVKTGVGSPAGPVMDNCTSNLSGQGGFLFSSASSTSFFLLLQSCIADGPFPLEAFKFVKTNSLNVSNIYAGSLHATGGPAVLLDNVVDAGFVGGIAAGTGATSADFSFKNACSRITLKGVHAHGGIEQLKSDGTTHTRMHVDIERPVTGKITNNPEKFEMQGLAYGDLATRFTATTSSAAIANTAAETAFSVTHSVPAHNLIAGATLRIRAAGVYSTTGTPTLLLRALFGNSIVTDALLTTALNSSNRHWTIEGEMIVRSAGAAGTMLRGWGLVGIGGASPIETVPSSTTGTFTMDTTIAQICQVNAQWGEASPSNTITMQAFTAEVVQAGRQS